MKRYFLFFLLAAVAVGLRPQVATAQTTLTPGWLAWLGNGSEGTYSCTSGTCVLGGEHWFSSFTVGSGATVVNTTINSPVIIRSTGECIVNGAISNSANTGGQGINFNGDFGGAGGGGGGGAVGALIEGQNGLDTVGIAGLPIANGGPGGGAGAAGVAGQSVSRGQFHMILSSGSFWPVGGSAGGEGGCNGHGKCGGNEGAGGGPVILICSSLNFTGTIDASGGPGGAAPINYTGGGGGGGGGYVIFSALNYVANTGTINVSGGAGGSCNTTGCAVGAAGGSGFDYFETIQ